MPWLIISLYNGLENRKSHLLNNFQLMASTTPKLLNISITSIYSKSQDPELFNNNMNQLYGNVVANLDVIGTVIGELALL